MHEWPLVIFTMLIQASVGCIAVTLFYKSRVFGEVATDTTISLLRLPVLSAFLLGGLGLIASMFHLGNPLHAFYTLMHISSSWMSREVLVTALYMALLFISLVMLLVKRQLPVGLLTITALLGLADIYVMSAIYVNTQFQLWGGWFTVLGFYGSTLLLGGSLSAAMMIPALKRQNLNVEYARVLRISLAVSVAGLLLLLASASSLMMLLNQPLSIGIVEKILPEGLFGLNLLRTILLALGFGFAGRLLCQRKAESGVGLTLSLSAFCIIAAEGVGRYVFFSLGA